MWGACSLTITAENSSKPNWQSATWCAQTVTEYELKKEGPEVENIEIPFVEFPKIPRLFRPVTVTEKLDGTNSSVFIQPEPVVDGTLTPSTFRLAYKSCPDGSMWGMYAGSRNRWITPQADNFGFAAWVTKNADQLWSLGPGRHFGEWWGCGIQRGYGLKEKRFSLFNITRWCLHGQTPERIPCGDPRIEKYQDVLPECVGLVPVLDRLNRPDTTSIELILHELETNGSLASPGFMRQEGIVVFHTASGHLYKVTLENDETPKSQVQ